MRVQTLLVVRLGRQLTWPSPLRCATGRLAALLALALAAECGPKQLKATRCVVQALCKHPQLMNSPRGIHSLIWRIDAMA